MDAMFSGGMMPSHEAGGETASSVGKHKSFCKGFGFIIGEDGKEHFYHASELKGKPPQDGDVLYFDIVPSPKGDGKTVAVNVTGGTAGGQYKGVVKNFNDQSGYGFIELDGETHFVHHSGIVDNYLRENDVVWFDVGPSDKNPQQTVCKNVAGGTGRTIGTDKPGKGMDKGMGKGKGKGKGKNSGKAKSNGKK
eukprot:TRINITY_DN11150_c0_g1_i1.p1 TRINITY_DN11150_c0_g1~~TRINITY_DN11150_c0_g1_i1.p1  ORF type:complete len:193 (-),score=53.60 TRINITY_DN11150_c0_g1_i1:78-656(-)